MLMPIAIDHCRFAERCHVKGLRGFLRSCQVTQPAGLQQWLFQCGFILCLWTPSGISLAADNQLELGLGAGVRYDDNPRLATGATESVTIRQARPQVTVGRNTERSRLQAGVSGLIERSNRTSLVADRNDLEALLAGAYFFPRTSFSFNLGIQERATRISELEDTGQVQTDATRTGYDYGTSLEHQIQERSQLVLSAVRQRVDFDTPLLTEFDYRRYAARFLHEYSPTTTMSTGIRNDRYRPDLPVGGEVDTWAVTYGWGQDLSEILHLSVNTAWARIDRDQGRDREWEVETALAGGDELQQYGLRLSRTNDPSAAGEVRTVEQVDLNFARDLGENLTAGIDGVMRSASSMAAGDIRQRSLRPYLGVALSPDWRMRAEYSLRRLKRGAGAGWASSNAFFLSFEYTWQSQ